MENSPPLPQKSETYEAFPTASAEDIIFCEAMARNHYNLSATAKELGIHYTQAQRNYRKPPVQRYLDMLLQDYREATAFNLVELGRQAVVNALYDPLPVLKALTKAETPEEAVGLLEALPETVRRTISELSWDKEGRPRVKFVNRQTALELCFKVMSAEAAAALSSNDPGRMTFNITIGGTREEVIDITETGQTAQGPS